VLGPIDVTIEPGEMVFVVGGNGSGKTTLAKIIIGLYSPEQGAVRLNGELINEELSEYYRQHFSSVFADFFLFDTLLGAGRIKLDKRAHEYLAKLHLDHKVTVKDGVLSTTDLSRGQRKRLALLTAYLEDRPFYIFDEWASDQDPVFKEIFYTQLLPELKSRGKTLIVITHDEKYFDLADRLLKLEYGKLQSDSIPPEYVVPQLEYAAPPLS
jgi:putative ATP-binding cassette transporter